MSENETPKRFSDNGEANEDIETIDAIDLFEDDEDILAGDPADTPSDLSEARWNDSDTQRPPAEDDLLRILEENEEEDDEEIIDLVDRVGEEEDDEEIIDLVDRIDEEIFNPDRGRPLGIDADPSQADAVEKTPGDELEDDFLTSLDLEEILGDKPAGQYAVDTREPAPEFDEESDFDFLDASDTLLEPEADTPMPGAGTGLAPAAFGEGREPDPAGPAPGVRLSDEQVEAAVERVIRKMYADKIDAILVEAIEKTVSEEIDRLKNLLNQGAPDL